MTLELTQDQFGCFFTSISQHSTNQLFPKFDIIKELNFTIGKKMLFYIMFATLMMLTVLASCSTCLNSTMLDVDLTRSNKISLPDKIIVTDNGVLCVSI